MLMSPSSNINPFTVKGEKSLCGFRLGTSIDHFQSDGAANVAVKGLILLMIIVVISIAPISPTRVSTSHFTRSTNGAHVHAHNLQEEVHVCARIHLFHLLEDGRRSWTKHILRKLVLSL